MHRPFNLHNLKNDFRHCFRWKQVRFDVGRDGNSCFPIWHDELRQGRSVKLQRNFAFDGVTRFNCGNCLFRRLLFAREFGHGFARAFNCLCDSSQLLCGALEPIRAPNSMYDPSVILEDALPKTISVTRGTGRVISRPITFNSQDISPRFLLIHHGKVNKKAGYSHLGVNLETQSFHSATGRLFKRRLFVQTRRRCNASRPVWAKAR